MADVYVVNQNVHPYRDKFRDLVVDIPPGGSIVMEHSDAIVFLGSMNAVMLDVDGNPKPETYKMLKIKPMSDSDAHTRAEEEAKAQAFICHIDGKKFATQTELDSYLQTHFSHLKPARDEVAEQEIATRAKRKATVRG